MTDPSIPTDQHPRRGLHDLKSLPAHIANFQSRAFGSFRFNPLYLVVTVAWVLFAQKIGLDNPGLTIYTFGVSVLAIYMASLVLNTQNRQADRDRARDDLEATEVDELLTMNRRQIEILATQDKILALIERHVVPNGARAPECDVTEPPPDARPESG